MSKSFKTAIDLGKNELQNAVIQNLSSAPSSPVKGLKYFDSTVNIEYYYNGTAWVPCSYSLTINNNGNNRLLSSNNTVSSIDAEANLTFDGTLLQVGGFITIGNGMIGINIGGATPTSHLDMAGVIWQSGGSSINLAVDRTTVTQKWRISRNVTTQRFAIHHVDADVNLSEIIGIDHSTKAIRFNNVYTFPVAIGSVGQALRVPASGSALEWFSPSDGLSGDWSAPSSDHTFKGFKRNMPCGGVTMNFGDVGYIATNGKIEFADADAIGTTGALVMATSTVTSNNYADFLLLGIARDDSWNWVIGGPVYVSTSGSTGNTLTQTIPSGSEDVVQIVGFAIGACEIAFNPNLARLVIR